MNVNMLHAQSYYEYTATKNITMDVGEIITLDPYDIDDRTHYYFNIENLNPEIRNEQMEWVYDGLYSVHGNAFYMIDESIYELTPTKYGSERYATRDIKVVANRTGTHTIDCTTNTKSKTQTLYGSTEYVKVRAVFNITVKETSKPKLTLAVNNSSKRVMSGTTILFEPSFPDASVYVREEKFNTQEYHNRHYYTTKQSVTLSSPGDYKITAFARKLYYPSSDIVTFEYKVLQRGDFSVMMQNGAEVHFNVLSEKDKTCTLYYVPQTVEGSFTIPGQINGYTVVGIEDEALYGCEKLTSVTIPETIESIGENSFSGCRGLTSLTIPHSVKSIGKTAFRDCDGLTTLSLPASIKNYGTDSFAACSELTSIQFEEGAEIIGQDICYACDKLEEILIPGSVKNIVDGAFRCCPNLKSVTSLIENPFPISEYCFLNSNLDFNPEKWTTATLYVPKGCKEKYASISGWLLFKNIVEIEPEPTTQGDVNGDGSVNGTDLVALANIILGKQSETVAADVNGDGAVNGTDIVALCNIILGRTTAAAPRRVATLSTNEGASLAIQPLDIKAGETKTMTIDLNNPNDELTLVQFDLHLPKGLSIKTVGGDLDIDMCDRTNWRKHSLEANEVDGGAYRFLLYSSSNTLISGTEGGIITVNLVADNTFAEGNIVIDNALLVSPEQEETKPAKYEYTIGEVTPPVPPTSDAAALAIESFSIKAGETKTMTINLNNPNDELTLVQFDLHLPKGLGIKTVGGDLDIDMCDRTNWRKHSLEANEVDGGAYRFLLYSSSNTLISGTEGGIITVNLVADNTFAGGNIVIDNALLVSPEQEETKPETYQYTIGSTTGIDDITTVQTPQRIFNLNGQQLRVPQRGINIVDGKKVWVK